jgi:hypothetical protein
MSPNLLFICLLAHVCSGTKKNGIKKHIMISYQWGAQRFASELHELLVQKGFPVWMDIKGGMDGGINTPPFPPLLLYCFFICN